MSTRRFVPVESFLGRRMVGAKGARVSNDDGIPPEIRAWNDYIDRRRAEKKANKGRKSV